MNTADILNYVEKTIVEMFTVQWVELTFRRRHYYRGELQIEEYKVRIKAECKGYEDNKFIYELQFNYGNLSEVLKYLAEDYRLENTKFI